MSRHGKIDWKRYGICLYYTIFAILSFIVVLALFIFPFIMWCTTGNLWWMFVYLVYFIFIYAGSLYQEWGS